MKDIDELRFISTSPTFTTEKAKKEKREFYIPRLNRERSLYGTEFEVKLRNELTQKAIAKECADWIREKVIFKSNVTSENISGFMNVDDKNYTHISGFTTVPSSRAIVSTSKSQLMSKEPSWKRKSPVLKSWHVQKSNRKRNLSWYRRLKI